MLETFISSRLTAAGRWTSSDGRAVAEIAEATRADDIRPRYEWTLKLDGNRLGRSDDLYGHFGTFLEALHSLAHFLTAWAEARMWSDAGRRSENWDLFPDACEPWLDYADEFYSDTMTEEDE